MTLTRFHIFISSIIAALSLALLPACSSDSDCTPDDAAAGVIRFSLDTSDDGFLPLSRVSYTETGNIQFSHNNDHVGCVIAHVNPDGSYVYIANTKWVYWDPNIHYLILRDEAYGPDGQQISAYAQIAPDKLQFKLTPGIDYAFFFYFPFNSQLTQANWKNFEISTILDGSDKTDLANSDFMYDAITQCHGNRINASNYLGDITVSLKKQLSTIDLCFHMSEAEGPDPVNFVSVRPYNTMRKSRLFNFSTGLFLDEGGSYYSGTEDIIPCRIGTMTENVPELGVQTFAYYRFLMAPQPLTGCDIYLTNADKFSHTINLTPGTNRPDSFICGARHRIRIFQLSGWGSGGWH